ncbi:MAG: hypothetical protein ACPGWR_10375 [Ardenticatenaceae bacterium]
MAKIRHTLTHPDLFKRGDPKMLFFASLQDDHTFKLGEVLTPNQMLSRVKTVANGCGVPDMASEKLYGTPKKLTQLLNDIYCLKRTTVNLEGQETKAYEFIGFKEVGLKRIVIYPQNPHLYTENTRSVDEYQKTVSESPPTSPTQSPKPGRGVRERALEFWLLQIQMGVEEGWLCGFRYESWSDHVAEGRVTPSQIKQAYESMHAEACSHYLGECRRLLDKTRHSPEATDQYLAAIAFKDDPKALKEHYEEMEVELFWE